MNGTAQTPSSGSRRPGTPARPPFAFSATAPEGWEALRGDAPSLHDDLVAVVARSTLWGELDARQQRGVASVLGEVARVSATTGAAATLLHMGATGGADDDVVTADAPPTDPAVSSVTLTWLRTAPVLADLDLARLVLDGGEPVTTGLGPGLLARRVEPGPTGGEQVTAQLAAPLPESIWLAVLTGTTTALAHAPALEEAVLAVGRSLQVDRPSA